MDEHRTDAPLRSVIAAFGRGGQQRLETLEFAILPTTLP